MSYPMDLDEYTIERLVAELKRRGLEISEGRCAYCQRPVTTEPCRYDEQHVDASKVPHAEATLHAHGDKKGMDIGARLVAATVFIENHALGTAFGEWLKRYV